MELVNLASKQRGILKEQIVCDIPPPVFLIYCVLNINPSSTYVLLVTELNTPQAHKAKVGSQAVAPKKFLCISACPAMPEPASLSPQRIPPQTAGLPMAQGRGAGAHSGPLVTAQHLLLPPLGRTHWAQPWEHSDTSCPHPCSPKLQCLPALGTVVKAAPAWTNPTETPRKEAPG